MLIILKLNLYNFYTIMSHMLMQNDKGIMWLFGCAAIANFVCLHQHCLVIEVPDATKNL